MTDAELMRWLDGYLARCESDSAADYERGYWDRVAEENAAYPPPKVLTFGRWYDQALEREKHDAIATQPRPTDNEVQ